MGTFALCLAATLLTVLQPSSQPLDSTTPAPRTDEGWVQRHDAFNTRARQGAEKGDIGIIFLGDSITQGWEGAGREVWARLYEPRNAVNFGIGGDRTQHVIYRVQNGNLNGLARPTEGSPPRLVVLMIGTNNIGSDTPEAIAEGIEGTVLAIRGKLPETPILLLGVFPRGAQIDDPLRSTVGDINGRIARLADRKNVVYLDIGDRFVAEGGAIPPEIMPDALHLSSKGYEIWAEAMEPTLKRMLGE